MKPGAGPGVVAATLLTGGSTGAEVSPPSTDVAVQSTPVAAGSSPSCAAAVTVGPAASEEPVEDDGAVDPFTGDYPAPGWTYGFDWLTKTYPNHGDGEISLVLTTEQGILVCSCYAPTLAPLSPEAVTALCDEFRAFVYAE
jgi:hypothetical protein